MLTGATTEYINSEAPTLYPKARECHKCQSRVSRYTAPYVFQKPERIVLLCSPCDFARRSTNLSPLEYVGRAKVKNPKKRRYTSTLGNTGGIMLPGLSDARIQVGISRDVLSRKAGCSKGHLYDVESGRRRASRELARRLARQLSVTIEELEEKAESGAKEMSAGTPARELAS